MSSLQVGDLSTLLVLIEQTEKVIEQFRPILRNHPLSSRELSLAHTNIQQGQFWLNELLRLIEEE